MGATLGRETLGVGWSRLTLKLASVAALSRQGAAPGQPVLGVIGARLTRFDAEPSSPAAPGLTTRKSSAEMPTTGLMIYGRDQGPNGLRLWMDPTVRVFLGLITLSALFVIWYELEPMLTFRPVDASVVGSDVAHVKLSLKSETYEEYQSEVFYRYEIAGTRYMGRNYSRLDLNDSPTLAELRAGANRPGSAVQAWYNPLRPEEAVLSREPDERVLALTSLLLLTCWLASSRKMLRAG